MKVYIFSCSLPLVSHSSHAEMEMADVPNMTRPNEDFLITLNSKTSKTPLDVEICNFFSVLHH
jgi:hypothetical protein